MFLAARERLFVTPKPSARRVLYTGLTVARMPALIAQ